MVEARAPDGGAMRRGEGRRGRDHEEEVPGHGHTPKKRSITDLFTAALAVDGPVAAEDEEEVQGDVRRRRRTSWNHRQRPSGSFRRGLDGACRPRQRWGDPHRAAEGASLLPPRLSDDNVTLDIISGQHNSGSTCFAAATLAAWMCTLDFLEI
ncbi:hypothetical protein PVAP13_3NG004400 [Panicum virgatum]|uniref:Uncharacterized protein n=1 Tax=Panicum virgatum TaxID=38727 RepID=A0A8T0TV90_PANVG|nr:hypothetical protein PVAP13_3NG004400 [Panicum virgatum]KAG2614720.1 hypothetical protein PVAP13_3NG004400 [Panicum virgatum]